MDKKLIAHNFPKSSKTIEVRNPANNKLLVKLPANDIRFVKKAINDANLAFPNWAGMSAWDRAKILHSWFKLIDENRKAIAQIMHEESGKLYPECLVEVDYAASFIPWYAEEAKRNYGEIIPMPKTTNMGIVAKQPVGVVAAITPWNFPAAMITRKVSPALAAGCTVVCKPSSSTPLTAIALQNFAEQAGMPKGVFQVVVGNANEIGKELSTNPKIRKISFTGSTEVGKQLMEQASGTVKKITMELGGNAPFIIFNDADIDKAVDGAIASRFRFSGQTCICANRFIVEDKIYDEFAKKITAKVRKMEIAPLINEQAIEKVTALVENAGGKILCGGKSKGNFFEPTVIRNVSVKNEIFSTEIFGPVVTLFKFKGEDEAVKLANNTPYGLASYLYTSDKPKAERVSAALDFGMVGVNEVAISSSFAPFGGFKESGIGREGSHYGIQEYYEIKYINFGVA